MAPLKLLILIAALIPNSLSAQDSVGQVTLLAGQGSFTGASKVFVRDGQLWINSAELPAATGFESKPEGLCSEDSCIPLPADGSWQKERGERQFISLSAFAEKLDQVLIRDRENPVWSLAQAPLIRERNYSQALAPDFELPDRDGRPVRLSDFRGKKLLLLTWASW
ncbi:MAG: peroxiredoxin family protein [Planctomycetota bacterium]|jgi:hypothetical protein